MSWPYQPLLPAAAQLQAGGGDVTVALSGQTATFSEGTVSASHWDAPLPYRSLRPLQTREAWILQQTSSVAALSASDVSVHLSGQTATFSQGTVSPAIAAGLTNQTATFSEGSLVAALSYALSEQTATFSEGTITRTGDALANLTGQTASFTEGSLGPEVDAALSGQTATFSEGAPTYGVSPSLAAQTATFAEGTVGSAVDIPLSGQTATFSEGTVSAETSTAPTMPYSPVRGLQTRTSWFLHQNFSLRAATAVAEPAPAEYVPSPFRRPLQTRTAWVVHLVGGFTNEAISAAVTEPSELVALADPIAEHWDVEPYPRQQPRPGIAAIAATIPRDFTITPQGGLVFAGSAPATRGKQIDPAGGLMLGGEGFWLPNHIGVNVYKLEHNRQFYSMLNKWK